MRSYAHAQPRGRPRKGCFWDAYRGWVREDGSVLPVVPVVARRVVIARVVPHPVPSPRPAPPASSPDSAASTEDREQLMHLAELAERRAAEEESARRAAEVREHRLRAQERYVAELQTRVSYPVYFIDHKGDMYNAGEEPREYRKRPPPPPTQEPKK